MTTLYEIADDLKAIFAAMEQWAEEHDGCVDDFPLADQLEAVGGDYQAKCLNIGCMIKEFLAEAGKFDAEIQTLKARQRSYANRAERLKSYLQANLPPGMKFEDARCKIGWRKSEALIITCPVMELPEEFLKFADPEPKKQDIKNAIKSGREIPGVTIETKHNVQIK